MSGKNKYKKNSSEIDMTETEFNQTEFSDDNSVESTEEVENCSLENVIEQDNEYFGNDTNTELKEEKESKIILEDENRLTNPYITYYEAVRIIGERTRQLTMGAKPLVKNYEDLTFKEIAVQELFHNTIPFKIGRSLPGNKYEIWKIEELDKKNIELLLE